jgi:hypothetical protein
MLKIRNIRWINQYGDEKVPVDTGGRFDRREEK